MSNVSKPSALVEREIEKKIDAAVQAEIAKGRQPADWGRRDSDAVVDAVRDKMSPAARDALVEKGVLHMVRCVFGEMIAEELWRSGRGYAAAEAEVVHVGEKLRMDPPSEAPENLAMFREDLAECTYARLEDTYKSAERWRRLFAGQPAGALLGEVATRKAMSGGRLAMAFLVGCEVAS